MRHKDTDGLLLAPIIIPFDNPSLYLSFTVHVDLHYNLGIVRYLVIQIVKRKIDTLLEILIDIVSVFTIYFRYVYNVFFKISVLCHFFQNRFHHILHGFGVKGDFQFGVFLLNTVHLQGFAAGGDIIHTFQSDGGILFQEFFHLGLAGKRLYQILAYFLLFLKFLKLPVIVGTHDIFQIHAHVCFRQLRYLQVHFAAIDINDHIAGNNIVLVEGGSGSHAENTVFDGKFHFSLHAF